MLCCLYINKWCKVFFYNYKFDRVFFTIFGISKYNFCYFSGSNFRFVLYYELFWCRYDDRIVNKCFYDDVYGRFIVNLEFDSMVFDFYYCVNFFRIVRCRWVFRIYCVDCSGDVCNEVNFIGVGVRGFFSFDLFNRGIRVLWFFRFVINFCKMVVVFVV